MSSSSTPIEEIVVVHPEDTVILARDFQIFILPLLILDLRVQPFVTLVTCVNFFSSMLSVELINMILAPQINMIQF